MGSTVRPVDQDTLAKPRSVEVVQYHAADLQRSPIDVPWEKQWTPLPPLDQIPLEARKEWMVTKNEDILELIDRAAERTPDKVAITWLGEKGKVEATYTFDQVARKSHGIAHKLLQKWGLRSGDHVILVYPPGPEFIIAFLACMRAGEGSTLALMSALTNSEFSDLSWNNRVWRNRVAAFSVPLAAIGAPVFWLALKP